MNPALRHHRTDRPTCEAFWRDAPLVQPYVEQRSRPLWNGEDIFFSLVSYKLTKLIPLVVKVKKVFMKQVGDRGIWLQAIE